MPPSAPARLVVLASGTGSLLETLLKSAVGDYPARVVAVGADRACRALDVAAQASVPTFTVRLRDYPDRVSWDAALPEATAAHEPDLVVSAGFMKILGAQFLSRFPARVVNTHPALLPAFPGAHAVPDALAYGVKVTGCSVHLVDAGTDTGPMESLGEPLDGKGFQVVGLGSDPGRASALKMCYAGLTKGTWTLHTAVLLAAEVQGLTAVLRAEFEHSQGQALAQMEARVPRLPADSRRWIGEMEEIAKTFADAGVTPGFHEGAAAVFRLLAQTPFAAETLETMDKSRTMEETVREAAKHLPGAEPKSDG